MCICFEVPCFLTRSNVALHNCVDNISVQCTRFMHRNGCLCLFLYTWTYSNYNFV